MTQEIIEMPQYLNASYEGDDLYTGDQVRELVKLVAAKEREAIWNILFDYAGRDDLTLEDESLLKHLADLIRARGEA